MSTKANLYEILIKPVVTEKTTMQAEDNQYTFIVKKDANKVEIRKAVELAFPGRKVSTVRTINMKPTERRFGKRVGMTQAFKKAIVTISEGDPIELIAAAGV